MALLEGPTSYAPEGGSDLARHVGGLTRPVTYAVGCRVLETLQALREPSASRPCIHLVESWTHDGLEQLCVPLTHPRRELVKLGLLRDGRSYRCLCGLWRAGRSNGKVGSAIEELLRSH
jgi:hypothetical protein